MEIVLKLKLCDGGKVKLTYESVNESAPIANETWNDLKYKIISNPEIVKVPETAPSSYGYAVNSETKNSNYLDNFKKKIKSEEKAIFKDFCVDSLTAYTKSFNEELKTNVELTKKIYTLTESSKILKFPSVNYFIEYLLTKKYIRRNGRKPSSHNNYYTFDNKDIRTVDVFYQKTPCQPVYVTQKGVQFFKDKLKIKD